VILCLSALEKSLLAQGVKIGAGTGVAAAEAHYAKSGM